MQQRKTHACNKKPTRSWIVFSAKSAHYIYIMSERITGEDIEKHSFLFLAPAL